MAHPTPKEFIDEVIANAEPIARDLYLFGYTAWRKGSADQKLDRIDPYTLIVDQKRIPPILSGWVCPVCAKGVSPLVQTCPCASVEWKVPADNTQPFPSSFCKQSATTFPSNHICHPTTTGACTICGATAQPVNL